MIVPFIVLGGHRGITTIPPRGKAIFLVLTNIILSYGKACSVLQSQLKIDPFCIRSQ